MSPGNASLRQQATDATPGVPAATGTRSQAAGSVHATGSEAPEPVSLAQIIESRNHRPMLRLQALQILEGICRSLDHSHRNGGVHGDVQPGNVLVTAEGQVRLGGHNGTPTPAYASCEVLEGATATAADDLFAAACTGYMLLAGEPAFGAGTALEAEAAGRRPARIPPLSPGQWRALDRALAFRRPDRPPDVETFLNELRSQYPGQSATDGTTSQPALPVTGLNHSPGPRLPLMPAGIAGIAAIVIALGWWLLRSPEAPADTAQPTVTTSAPEAGLVGHSAVAPVIDSTAVMPATPPADPQLSPAAPAQPSPIAPTKTPTGKNRMEAAPAEPLPAAPDPETYPSPAVAAGPEHPAAAPILIAPRPVVPALLPEAVPAITLPAAATAGDGVYMVRFSSLKLRRYVDPDYPKTQRSLRTAGWVDVGFGIDAEGRTTALQVNGAEPAGVFEDAALAAIRRWRFVPVEDPAGSGREVRSEIRVRFVPD